MHCPMAELTNPHDRFFKDLLARPEAVRDFLMHYLPVELVVLLDVSDLEMAKDSFVDAELRESFSDLLFKVRTSEGGPAYLYVLFEHKSHPDAMVAFQVLRYMVRIWEHHLRQHATLWPIVPLVVYHGGEAWRVERNLQALFDLPEAVRAYTPEYRYGLCDLSTYDDTQLKGELLLQVGLLALKYVFRAELREQLPRLLGLLRELLQREKAVEYIRTVLRYVSQATDRITEEDLRKAMQKVFPEGEAMMGTIAEKWIEQGKQLGLSQGLEQGLQTGRAEGVQQGRRQGLLDAIEIDLELRFGPDGQQLFLEIAKIEQVDVLRAIYVGMKHASSPDEVRLIYRNG